MAMNIWTVSLMRYGGGKIDQKMRKTEKLQKWWNWLRIYASEVILKVCMFLGQKEEKYW